MQTRNLMVAMTALPLLLASLLATSSAALAAPAIALRDIGPVADNDNIGCALIAREVWCWGVQYEQALQVGLPALRSMARVIRRPDQASGEFDDIFELAAAYNRSCVVARDGLWCWGANGKGQLGVGDRSFRSEPVRVGGLPNDIVNVELGETHTCALSASTGVWCWGSNDFGEAGQAPGALVTPPGGGAPEAPPLLTPQRIIGLAGTTVLAMGQQTSCALAAGRVWCWGRNDQGQLGDGTTASRFQLAPIETLPAGITRLVSGPIHSCAANPEGVWCWGNNSNAQVGIAPATGRLIETTPVRVQGLVAVDNLRLDFGSSCAAVAGERRCWGRGADGVALGPLPVATSRPPGAPSSWAGGCFRDTLNGGELRCRQGDERFPSRELDARQIPGLQGTIVELGLGRNFGCARMQDGSVWCWGENIVAQLGQGDTAPRATAVRVAVPSSLGLAVGASHACSVASDALWCWGANSLAALGIGTTQEVLSPVRARWYGRRVAAGADFTCVIDDQSGQVRCWGFNAQGQLDGNGSSLVLDALSPALSGPASEISAGLMHVCARLSGNAAVPRIECWGNTPLTQQDLGGVSTSVRSIQAGAALGNTPLLRSAMRTTCAGDRCYGSNFLPPDRGVSRIGVLFTPPPGEWTQWAMGGRHHCVAGAGSEVQCVSLVSRSCVYELNTGAIFTPGQSINCSFGESNLIAEAKAWAPVRGLPGVAQRLAAGDQYACAVVGQGLWCWGYAGAVAAKPAALAYTPVFREGAIEPATVATVPRDPARACPAYLVSSVSLINQDRADGAGAWGQEVLLQDGRRFLNGGLNFGGFGSALGRGVPGYAAFSTANALGAEQRIDLDLRGDGGRFELLVESVIPPSTQRSEVLREEVTLSATTLRRSLLLRNGFHIVSLLPREGTRLFLAALGTTQVNGAPAAFQGGAVVGGYLSGDQTGFAGICTDDASAVGIRTEARSQRGAIGAGDLRVRLLEGQSGAVLYDSLQP